MTYRELLERAERNGMNMADVAVGRMMDIVEEQTGSWPNWDDEAPVWVLRNFGYGYLDQPVTDFQLHGFLTADDLEEADYWASI